MMHTFVLRHELLKVKGLMKEKKITYKKMSLQIGMSMSTLCNKLNGKASLTTEDVGQMMAVLGLETSHIVEYFFQGGLQNDRNHH